MMINGYFTIMSIYGWYKWTKVKDKDSPPITRTNNKEKIIGIGLFFITIL
jgi:nicotinamide mononucleotide transporter